MRTPSYGRRRDDPSRKGLGKHTFNPRHCEGGHVLHYGLVRDTVLNASMDKQGNLSARGTFRNDGMHPISKVMFRRTQEGTDVLVARSAYQPFVGGLTMPSYHVGSHAVYRLPHRMHRQRL